MGTPGHLTCLLRNLHACQKQQLESNTEQWTGSKRSESRLPPCLFNLYAEDITQHAGLLELQTGIKIVRKNISNLRYVDDTTVMAESDEELKSLLMRVKEESEKLA